jgi:hypothetical protein
MTKDEKQTKIEAIDALLTYSLIFSEDAKLAIRDNLNTFKETEINGLGSILAIEHTDRSKLDGTTIREFFNTLEKFRKPDLTDEQR